MAAATANRERFLFSNGDRRGIFNTNAPPQESFVWQEVILSSRRNNYHRTVFLDIFFISWQEYFCSSVTIIKIIFLDNLKYIYISFNIDLKNYKFLNTLTLKYFLHKKHQINTLLNIYIFLNNFDFLRFSCVCNKYERELLGEKQRDMLSAIKKQFEFCWEVLNHNVLSYFTSHEIILSIISISSATCKEE